MMNSARTNPTIILGTVVFLCIAITIFIIYMYRSWIDARQKTSYTEPSMSINRQIAPLTSDEANTHSLRNYYILTSYNTCITGPYDSGVASIQNLRNALYMGFRCLDFEIYYDQHTKNPIVSCSTFRAADGSYPIQTGEPMLFSDIMHHITTYAFVSYGASNYADPLILSLRIKSQSVELQPTLADIFSKYSKFMVDPKYNIKNTDNFGIVKLPKIMNRISLFVDSPIPITNSRFLEYVNMSTRSKWFAIKYWSDYTNVVRSSENTTYTNPQITLIIPDPHIVDPANPNIKPYMDDGIQMVGLMLKQTNDSGFMNSLKFFESTHKSFILKPMSLIYPDSSYITESAPPPYKFESKPIDIPIDIPGSFEI